MLLELAQLLVEMLAFHVMASRRMRRSYPPDDGGDRFGGLRPPRGDMRQEDCATPTFDKISCRCQRGEFYARRT